MQRQAKKKVPAALKAERVCDGVSIHALSLSCTPYLATRGLHGEQKYLRAAAAAFVRRSGQMGLKPANFYEGAMIFDYFPGQLRLN